MAFQDMRAELRGCVPKLPFAYTSTLINRAYRTIRESNLWSFQLFESSWITPPLISTGTVTCATGSPNITFNATAVSAINAAQLLSTYSLITQRQFRNSAAGGIYNIISYNSITGATILDRPYADQATGAALSYQLYQVYYAAPYRDFLTWISITNPSMFLTLDLTQTRANVDATDPQRSWYQFPTCAVPMGTDLRGLGTANASATLYYKMYELWGQPVSPFTYQCYGIRKGSPLVAPTDIIDPSLDEELVLTLARTYAYKWAEANKDMSPRSAGPDFKFLIGADMTEYKRLLTLYRKQDKEFVDNWITSRGINLLGRNWGFYNTLAGTAGPYSQY